MLPGPPTELRIASFFLLSAFALLANGQSCSTPSSVSGYSNARLPNPFLFNDGTPVRTQADWQCRRAQISALVQGYEAGTLPPKPSTLTASFSKSGTRGTLTVNAGQSGRSVSFQSTINYPSGNPPAAGWPLIIAYGSASIPVPNTVATLNYGNENIAQQSGTSSRGSGIFYDLYGSSHDASAMTAWVWGVSRIIDALELSPTAQININRIGVTGGSRNGKGALMAGVFEERIVLTIPQESGSGGDTCWRLSKYEKDRGSDVQEAVQIVTENPWFSRNFENYVRQLNVLPYDHHLLAAMVAPRAMISYANTDYIWLNPMSSFGCMTAAHTVWEALGIPDRHGFAQTGGHGHCSFPSSLSGTLNAFINKFLLDQSGNTNIFQTNNQFNGVSWQASNWIDWTAPTLSGQPTTQPPTTQPPTTQPPTTQPPTTQPPTTQPPTTQPPTTQPPSGAARWAQCGGIGWTGATTCQSPYTCTPLNDWYYQCL